MAETSEFELQSGGETERQRRHRKKKNRHRKKLIKRIVVVALVIGAWGAALWFWHILVQDSPPR